MVKKRGNPRKTSEKSFIKNKIHEVGGTKKIERKKRNHCDESEMTIPPKKVVGERKEGKHLFAEKVMKTKFNKKNGKKQPIEEVSHLHLKIQKQFF